jgi:hypothetical protein
VEQQDKAKDAVMGILQYINSPFKLFVVVLLGILGYVGYFVYDNKVFLLGVYEKSNAIPKLNTNRLDDVVELIMKDPNVVVVAIMSVDTIFNKRVVVRVENRDRKRAKNFDGTNVGLFTSNHANNADVVDLMAGSVPCSFYSTPQSELGLYYIEQGATFGCRISVPPEYTSFIGQITVMYKDAPLDLEKAKAILTIAARMLSEQK